MSDPTDSLAWAERTEEDYALARLALEQAAPLIYGATFHAQQDGLDPALQEHLLLGLLSDDQRQPSNLGQGTPTLAPGEGLTLEMLVQRAVRLEFVAPNLLLPCSALRLQRSRRSIP